MLQLCQLLDDYLVEICARAYQRDFKEDEATKEIFVQELDELTKKVELEQSKGSGYFLRNKVRKRYLVLLN